MKYQLSYSSPLREPDKPFIGSPIQDEEFHYRTDTVNRAQTKHMITNDVVLTITDGAAASLYYATLYVRHVGQWHIVAHLISKPPDGHTPKDMAGGIIGQIFKQRQDELKHAKLTLEFWGSLVI